MEGRLEWLLGGRAGADAPEMVIGAACLGRLRQCLPLLIMVCVLARERSLASALAWLEGFKRIALVLLEERILSFAKQKWRSNTA